MKKYKKILFFLILVITGCTLLACADSSNNDDNQQEQQKQLESISVSGYKTDFKVGDAFDKTGLVVTAKYSDNSTENVTSKATVSTPDMTTAGTPTVTVTYEGKTATYTIHVVNNTEDLNAYFSVTVHYDSSLGSYIITESNEENKYKKGTMITIEVLPNASANIAGFKVDEEDKTLNNNIFQFEINKNTDIQILFDKKNLSFSEPLLSLKGNVKFLGEYTLKYNSEVTDISHKITTIFEDDKIFMLETDSITDEVYYELLYKNVNDKLAMLKRTVLNEVNFINSSYSFDDYDNPFNNIEADDFKWVTEDMAELVNENKRKEIASCLTGWNESISFMLFYVEDNKVTRIEFETNKIVVDATSGLSYVSTYSFDVMDHQTAKIEEKYYTPYTKTSEHLSLENALKDILPNYTIKHLDQQPGYEDVEYNVYVTDTAVYSDCTDYENGYVELDNYIYPFTYDKATSKVTLEDPISNFETFREALANFTCFDAAVLESKGNGVYSTRDSSIASEILSNFGEGYDEKMVYSYGQSLEIEIKDGKLFQIRFNYEIYGNIGYVVLTYSDFNQTTMPISFENADKQSVLEEFYGTYSGSNKSIIINKEGIFIDGVAFVVQGYDSSIKTFSGTLNDVPYYITKLSSKQIILSNINSKEDYVLTIHDDGVITLPEEYKGIWKDENNTLRIQSHVVYFNNTLLELISYNEQEGIICLLDNKTYNFVKANLEIKVLIITSDGIIESSSISLSKTDESIGVEIPLEYVGIYSFYDEQSQQENLLEITLSEIKLLNANAIILTFDEQEGFNIVLNDAAYTLVFGQTIDTIVVTSEGSVCQYQRINSIKESYIGRYLSIVAESDYEIEITKTSILINGTEYSQFRYDPEYGYVIEINNISTYLLKTSFNGNDLIVIYDNLELQVTCERINYIIPKSFLGTWESRNLDTEIKVVINSLSVKVNGKRLDIESISSNAIIGELGDIVNYELSFGAFSQDYMYVGTEEENYMVYKVEQETPTPPSEIIIPEKYIGIYEGTKDNQSYQIIISKNEITVNGNVVEITEYDEVDGFTFIFEGVTYYISKANYDEEVTSILYMTEDYTLMVTLVKK